MKIVKAVLLVGMSAFASASAFAIPLDITFTGGAPADEWGLGFADGNQFQFENAASVTTYSSSQSGFTGGEINLAGVNSINVTWNAPAGYMYVVSAPPASIGQVNLQFEAAYGWSQSSLISSLGSVASSSLSVHTISGSSPLSEYVALGNGQTTPGSLVVNAGGYISPGDKPFSFNSITVSADFSGTGAAGTLGLNYSDLVSGYFGVLLGMGEINTSENLPGDPGLLFTLEPLPSGSVPDDSSTLCLAGIGFAGLLLFRGKSMAVN